MESRVLLSGYSSTTIDFTLDVGAIQDSTLAVDPQGTLYGTTSGGGANYAGGVFKIPSGTTTIEPIAFFNHANGANPTGGVTLDSAGNLFGATYSGGLFNKGTIFEILHGTSTIQTLASFDGINGSAPLGPLTLDAAGNIYGIAALGDTGFVFRLDHGTGKIQSLGSFNDTDLSQPEPGVTLDPAGNIYGATHAGGPSGMGAIFKIDSGTNTIRSFAPFDGANGRYTNGGLILDAAGDLYGTTGTGGSFDRGTVFKIVHGTNKIVTVAAFDGANGQAPAAGVTMDAAGNLYGATDEGVVYEVVHGTGSIQRLASMGYSSRGVTLDGKGNLWGTLNYSRSGLGSVFELSPIGSSSNPFPGNRFNINTDTIQAEDFNNGGENVAFHDTTSQNIPGAYRSTGVDVASVANASNGFAVGYTEPGEWLAYSIHAPSAGTYVLQSRVANYQQGGTFLVEIDGQDLTGAMTVPDTGPWDTWQTISSPSFKVSAGNHTMRVVMDTPGYWGNVGDFDSFKFVEQMPFRGTPFNINDTIEAEDFDNGGEAVAYHDTTPQNIPGAYRNTGVDVASVASASNGFAVGYTAPGEWLDYSVTTPSAGTYAFTARVANSKQGGTFHVEVDGANVTGNMAVPDTGSWNTWQTLTSQAFTVSAGPHLVRVVMDRPGYWGNIGDFDSFRFVARTPFRGTPFNINTDTIEAEDFDNGGEAVAYHDTTPQNIPGAYRGTGVDVGAVANASNGYAVGYTAPGEWLDYSIATPSDGTYVLQARVADYLQGGTFHVEVDGQNVTGAMTVPNTGPWDTWQTVSSPTFNVLAGEHTMRVVMDGPGYWGNVGDFDSFRFVAPVPYLGHPFKVGAETIEAENFDNGGPDATYHDTTPQNIPGQYRNTTVDINAGGSNGYDVGYTAPGEWLRYSIVNPSAATFVLQAAVASLKQGGTFHAEIDGRNVTGAMTVPDTGGWSTYQTVVSPKFTLTGGGHLMRVVMDSAGALGAVANFDYFRFAPAGIITLVSQERSVTIDQQYPTQDQVARTDPGDFSPFDASVRGPDFMGGVEASQSSRLDVSPTGASLSAELGAISPTHAALAFGVTKFKVVFDVESPLTYLASSPVLYSTPSLSLTGPAGAIPIPYDPPHDRYFATGMLQPGRYTLSGEAMGNGQFNMALQLGSLAFMPHGLLGGGTIEAEMFDDGAEGVTYHDTTPQNLGGQYRPTGVDINPGGSSGYNVGYTAPGEWLKYDVNNLTAGDFLLQAAVASSRPGGTFHVEIDGQNVTGPMTVPDTGGWYNFQTVTSPRFHVSAADHTMKVVMDSAGPQGAIGNLDYFRFVPTGIVTPASQNRSASLKSLQSNTSRTSQTDPGDFGAAHFGIGELNFAGADAFQTSDMQVGDTGARFTTSFSEERATWGTQWYPDSSFQVVFDVGTAVPYTVSSDQTGSQGGQPTLKLEGPGGPVFAFDPTQTTYSSTGMLQPGRYTFSTSISCYYLWARFQAELDLGSTITPVKGQ